MIQPIDAASRLLEQQCAFSICTLVTKTSQYMQMVSSFEQKGFGSDDCEFLLINNSKKNRFDAFQGLNLFLRVARGKYVILCHQDVFLHDHARPDLEERIAEVNALDENWALLGNAGGNRPGEIYIRITDCHGENTARGPFPTRVRGLDENFIVVKAAANLALSGDLTGFHAYGTDICLVADMLGYNAYVIDFHLKHRWDGSVMTEASELKKQLNAATEQLRAKYLRAYRNRWIYSPFIRFFITGSKHLSAFINSSAIKKRALLLSRLWTRCFFRFRRNRS